MLRGFIFFLLLSIHLFAYHSEDKIKAIIVGKLAKYISYEKRDNSDTFIITILGSNNKNLFKKIYKNRKIKNKIVKIQYIDRVQELKKSDILYISSLNTIDLKKVLYDAQKKHILTVSDMRGFAQRGGMVQIYFVAQRARLKINLDSLQQAKFQIKSSLLKIADVLQKRENE